MIYSNNKAYLLFVREAHSYAAIQIDKEIKKKLFIQQFNKNFNSYSLAANRAEIRQCLKVEYNYI